MKKFIVLTLALLSFHFAQAQENTAPTRQFGFDGAGFLSRFLNFSGTGNTGIDTYFLTYRKFNGDRNARYGLGFNLNIEGDGDGGTNTSNSISFRGGSERFHDFGKTLGNTTRWRAFYGVDGKFFFSLNTAGGFDNSVTAITAGIAPIFGLQFRINERLSLSTELAYNAFLTFRDSNGNSRLGLRTVFDSPSAVFVNYDF